MTKITGGNSLARIARRFIAGLRDELTCAEFDAMRISNSARTSNRFCYSHDYCDADMVMMESIQAVVGKGDIDILGDNYVNMRNSAWLLANQMMEAR